MLESMEIAYTDDGRIIETKTSDVKRRSDAYDAGYHYGYAAAKHDIFVPMIVWSIVCGAAGYLMISAVI